MARPPADFLHHVYAIVGSIPTGRVMTYGSIAALIPPPPDVSGAAYLHLRARWVGQAMALCPDGLPWQRVVNSQGRISRRPGRGPQQQRILLEREGVIFDERGRIDLGVFGWSPPAPDARP